MKYLTVLMLLSSFLMASTYDTPIYGLNKPGDTCGNFVREFVFETEFDSVQKNGVPYISVDALSFFKYYYYVSGVLSGHNLYHGKKQAIVDVQKFLADVGTFCEENPKEPFIYGVQETLSLLESK